MSTRQQTIIRYKVTHHYADPRQNSEELHVRRAEAIMALKQFSSSDPNDPQYSELENLRTGEMGVRTWGRRRIRWTKPAIKAPKDQLIMPLAILLPTKAVIEDVERSRTEPAEVVQ